MGTLADAWSCAFGPDGNPNALGAAQLAARAVFVYGAGLALLRLGGHRILGRYSAVDIVVGILLGSVLSRAVNGAAPLGGTLAAGAALVAVHRLLAFAASRRPILSRIVKGQAHALVRDGHLVRRALARQSVSLHEIEEAVRLAGHDPRHHDVDQAWLERDGRISVISRSTKRGSRGPDTGPE